VEGVPTLRVVSIGDINYDLAYNEFPAGFFSGINAPGAHVDGELYRAAGGTAAIFALRARRAGFKRCAILGVIGGDALGKSIEEELNRQGIRTLLPADYSRRTSIALILRDRGEKDTAVTLTDAHQALSLEDVQRARPEIEAAHVLFISGYCLTDPNRRQAALRAIELAKEGGGLVVVDVTVDMNKAFALDEFLEMTQAKVDVLVAEIPTVLAWLGEQGHAQDEWDFILDQVVPSLRGHFPTLFLRTSTYTYEIIASPAGVTGPVKLDYAQRPASQRLGYADEKTSQHLYQFMSPRVLSASASPRRLELLKQIVAENKIEVLISDHAEAHKAEETPTDRVKRLALEKARRVLARREEFSPGIELVIGADTEIVLGDEVVGHPGDAEEARQILRRLSGKTHEAITGLAVLDTQNGREFVDAVSTRVTFKTLSRDEIEQYVASGEPVGKAGAYGIQGKGALFVQEIDGSYSNVVGLPLEFLCEVLDREFGKPIWEINKVSSWRLPCGEGGETQ
jgi:septum formation protein